MINKKSLLSVAAAVAISSSIASADYLPLTSTGASDKWQMFGVTGFHSNGATDGTAGGGAVDAGMFSIDEEVAFIAKDTGGDELYGHEPSTPANSITSPLGSGGFLAGVKRIDGEASEVEVRVDVTGIQSIAADPVRTIYVKQNADDASILFAFSYKSALEGKKLEFSTTTSGTTDDAYRITINSENTYNNPAIAEYIPAIEADPDIAGSSGSYLTSISHAIDYDFTDGPSNPNPINSAKYLRIDHQDTAASGEHIMLYSYDPSGTWGLYDSRNSFQSFDTLEKGKGYWGKMTLAGGDRPAGFVLGTPSITPEDYIAAGIAEGWNLLAFNADNADLRAATTGLIVTFADDGDIKLTDVSGNHTVTLTATGSANAEVVAGEINHAVKLAKIEGLIPKTFHIVAMPTGTANQVALLSNEKFIFEEVLDATVTADITTLAGEAPLNAKTLEPHVQDGVYTSGGTGPALSKYGEYALVVKPENAAWAELDVKCDTLSSQLRAPTQAGLQGATCIRRAYDLDTDLDGTADNHILMASVEPFEIRDHTFTRVFDYTARPEAGELSFLSATAGTTSPIALPATGIAGAPAAVYTATLTDMVLDDGDTLSIDGTLVYTATVDNTAAAAVVTALTAPAGQTVVLSDGISYVITGAGAVLTLTAETAVDNPIADITGGVVATDNAPTGSTFVVPTDEDLTQTAAGEAPTAQEIATHIELNSFVDGNDIEVVGNKILFRMKGTNSNEFRVLETGDADNLTPSTTTDAWAKGAISDVYAPNSIIKATTTNLVLTTFTDVDPVVDTNVNISITTILNDGTTAAQTLEPYTIDALDVADGNVFYPKLQAHINTQLRLNNIDAAVEIEKGSTDAGEFDADLTLTGTDITTSTIVFATPGPVANTGTPVLGIPSMIDNVTDDLKFNYVLSPNYVLNGPLYEMTAAGFTPKAMVTGTMNFTGDTMNWDGIDLTRKPSEWLDSQDYNLFTVDNAAGYWTYLEPAEPSTITYETSPFSGNYTQHFNHDGKTFNHVAGGITVSVSGMDEYDDRKSARVVAKVGGAQVELSRQGLSNDYSAQISSRELKDLRTGTVHDILVEIADGLGNRIPAESSGAIIDYAKPNVPTVAFNAGRITISNPDDDGVTKYYVYRDNIPASSTESSKLLAITAEEAADFNLCGNTTAAFNKDTSYDLKFVALDGADLTTSNASDVLSINGYRAMFKNSAIIVNTGTGDPANSATLATEYYDATCTASEETFNLGMQAASYTDGATIKVSYTPKDAGTANPVTIFVDGGSLTGTRASLTYSQDYAGDTVFIQLSGQVFSLVLPTLAEIQTAGTPGESETNRINLSSNANAAYLEGQTLGE